VAAVPYLVFWVLGYMFFLRDRPPADVRLEATLERASDVSRIPKLQFSDGGSWRVRSADVQEVLVSRSAHGVVALPVGVGACSRIRPRQACSADVVKLASPVVLTWARGAQPFDASQDDVQRVTLSLRVEDRQLGLGVGAVAQGGLKLCLGSLESDTLALSAGSTTASWAVAVEDSHSCPEGGLRIGLEDTASSPATDAFFMGNVLTADVRVSAGSLVLTGRKSGQLHLGGPHDFAGEAVSIRGADPVSVQMHLEGGRRRASVVIPRFRASSARIAGEELLPTNLERNRWWVVSAFFGLAGLISTLITLGDLFKGKGEVKK